MPEKRQEIWKCLWNEFEDKQNGIETTSRNGVWLPERIKWMETTHLYMESGHVNLFGGLIVNRVSVMNLSWFGLKTRINGSCSIVQLSGFWFRIYQLVCDSIMNIWIAFHMIYYLGAMLLFDCFLVVGCCCCVSCVVWFVWSVILLLVLW